MYRNLLLYPAVFELFAVGKNSKVADETNIFVYKYMFDSFNL